MESELVILELLVAGALLLGLGWWYSSRRK